MGNFNNKFESAKQEWETPDEIFDILNDEFSFTFDLAADSNNAKVINYFTKEQDAITQEWIEDVNWLNPPYGGTSKNSLKNWVKKSYEQTQKYDNTIVLLIPARTNTNWWHQYCMLADKIYFVKGRIKFVGAKYGLPQPLAIIVFRKRSQGFLLVDTFNLKGG